MQIRISKFGKLKFLVNLTIMYIKILKKFIIFLAFKKIDLIFYNSEIVL